MTTARTATPGRRWATGSGGPRTAAGGIPAAEPGSLGEALRLLPNRITAARLALLPVLWLLVLLGETEFVGPGLLLGAATDVVDGIIARRTHTATRFGSAFDSVADHLMNASTALFLVLLRPAFVREQAVPLAAWALFTAGVLATGWVRRRRLANLHLYSAKAAGVAAYAFAGALFVSGGYSRALFAVVLGLAFVAEAEALAVLLTREEVDEHVGSMLRRRRRRRAGYLPRSRRDPDRIPASSRLPRPAAEAILSDRGREARPRPDPAAPRRVRQPREGGGR